MYNLAVLSDKEFELLAKDIIEMQERISLQVFRKGRDKGIDARYSCDRENKIIVQAKHYVNSTYSNLKSKLITEELPKIKLLKTPPERYILVTSLSLTVAQVDELTELLAPYIKTSNDIYGQDRINELVKSNARIEERYPKLWLASANILRSILSNGIKGKSEFYREKIIRKISLYVRTENFDEAISKLNDNRFILITGDPGVGKTTLAYILICELLAQGYELLYIDDKISEAENAISPDSNVKQIIFFDDFLGSNIAEIVNPRNTESTIVSFIERIMHSKNKLLILTTRTTILNQAKNSYEKFRRANFAAISKHQVEVQQYSRVAKAQILYNHLYHSELNKQFPNYFEAFFINKNYLRIIDHKNFSPRLIEFLTSQKTLNPAAISRPMEYVMSHLTNPSEVWKHAFENQLEDEDRFLLTTLFSLGGHRINHNALEQAYNQRLSFEIQKNGFQRKHDSFLKSIKKLLDGFIKSVRDLDSNLNEYSFLNPSVTDFLFSHLKTSTQEKWRILRSVIFIEQITKHFYPDRGKNENYIPFENHELGEFFRLFKELAPTVQFIGAKNQKSKAIEILSIYFTFFPQKIDQSTIKPWVDELRAEEITGSQYSKVIDILPKIVKAGCGESLIERWDAIILKLFQLCDVPDEFADVKNLFLYCDFDFNAFILAENNMEILRDSLARAFTQSFKDDPNLSSFDKGQIIEYHSTSHYELAEMTIQQSAESQFREFISDSGFAQYMQSLMCDLDIDSGSIIDRIIERENTFNEDIKLSKLVNEKRYHETDDNGAIDNLFEL